jgi:hypothetical protein
VANIESICHKASELGFTLSKSRGLARFSGYTLVDNDSGEVVVGPDASLKEVEKFLDNVLDDTDQVVEANGGEDKKAPLSDAEIAEALSGVDPATAAKVKDILDNDILDGPKPKLTAAEKLERRQRIAAIVPDRAWMLALYQGRLSEAEINARIARAREVRAEEEREANARLPRSKISLRDFDNDRNETSPNLDELARDLAGDDIFDRVLFSAIDSGVQAEARHLKKVGPKKKISVDDPAFAEKVRQNNAFRRTERRLKAASGADDGNFLPPEAGSYNAVSIATSFKREAKVRRLSEDQLRSRSEAAAIGELYRDKRLREAGRKLAKKKDELGHGGWESWLIENEPRLGFSKTTAWRLIRKK